MMKKRILLTILFIALTTCFCSATYAFTYSDCEIQGILECNAGTYISFDAGGSGTRGFYVKSGVEVNRIVAIALTAQSQNVYVKIITEAGTNVITGIQISNTSI